MSVELPSFKDRVLAVVACIPRGTFMTYKEVADAAGRPTAWRAVGTFMSQNHDPRIPCHRVIRSDGRAGGYNNGGAARKEALLLAEGVQLPGALNS